MRRYLDAPLLIDGFKFDLRIYVLVLSYEPLVVHMLVEPPPRTAAVPLTRDSRAQVPGWAGADGDQCIRGAAGGERGRPVHAPHQLQREQVVGEL